MAKRLAPLPPGAIAPNTITHREGQYLMLSSGSYSDYSVCCTLRVERDCDLTYLAIAYAAQAPFLTRSTWRRGIRYDTTSDDEHDLTVSGFAAWLDKEGWTTSLGADELRIDDCTSAEIFCRDIDEQVRGRRVTKL